MGVRTVHQKEAKAQLLVAVARDASNPWTAAHAAGALPDAAAPQAELEAATNDKVGGCGGLRREGLRQTASLCFKWPACGLPSPRLGCALTSQPTRCSPALRLRSQSAAAGAA